MGILAYGTLRSPLPSSRCRSRLLSSLLLPFLFVHVGRVVAMTPRAGGRLWRLFRPNPQAHSPGGKGEAAATGPLTPKTEGSSREVPSTPQSRMGSGPSMSIPKQLHPRCRGLGELHSKKIFSLECSLSPEVRGRVTHHPLFFL